MGVKEEGAVLVVPDVLGNVVIRENLRVIEFSSVKNKQADSAYY